MSLRLVSRSAAVRVRRAAVIAALGCGVGALGFGVPVQAGTVADGLSCEVRQVFEQVKGAIVKVEASDKTGPLCGSGFFIDPNGTLLTSFSVGGESSGLTIILPNRQKVTARCVAADPRAGVALLKADDVPPGSPFLPLATGSQPTVATPVMAVAYPMDRPLTPTFGFISSLDITYLGRCFATRHIRASVPVQRGEGGAPLLNMQGEVLGMVISSIDNGAACFAVPTAAMEKIRHDYEHYGAIRPGWLGVAVKAVDSGTSTAAEVESLEPGAPASKAGLKPGDRLVKIGKVAVQTPEDVLDASFFLTAGEKVTVTVTREGSEVALEAKPAERAGETPCEATHKVPTGPALNGDITLRLDQ